MRPMPVCSSNQCRHDDAACFDVVSSRPLSPRTRSASRRSRRLSTSAGSDAAASIRSLQSNSRQCSSSSPRVARTKASICSAPSRPATAAAPTLGIRAANRDRAASRRAVDPRTYRPSAKSVAWPSRNRRHPRRPADRRQARYEPTRHRALAARLGSVRSTPADQRASTPRRRQTRPRPATTPTPRRPGSARPIAENKVFLSGPP